MNTQIFILKGRTEEDPYRAETAHGGWVKDKLSRGLRNGLKLMITQEKEPSHDLPDLKEDQMHRSARHAQDTTPKTSSTKQI